MNNTTEILLFTVVSILTVLLVVIGFKIYQVLSEFKKILVKFNTLANNASSLSNNISKTFFNLTGFTHGLKTVFSIVNLISRKGKKNEPREE